MYRIARGLFILMHKPLKMNRAIFGLFVIFQVVVLAGLCARAADQRKPAQWNDPKGDASLEQRARDDAGGYTTYNFDNSRFWAKRNPSGGDLGNEGWLRITAKGRRDYIPGIDPKRTALIAVDLQNGLYGPNSWPEQLRPFNPEIADAWNQRMEKLIFPNVNRLTDFFRKHDMLIVWLTLNPSSIMPQLKTQFGRREVHLVKHSAGAFASSGIDSVLREFNIATTIVIGADTACCLMATVDGAYDRNYQTIVVEDACIASRPELHEAAIKIWAYRGFVRSTDQVIKDYPWKRWIDPTVRDKN